MLLICNFTLYYFHKSLDFIFFFFFSSRRRHTRCSRDWSSDVCSSDLIFRNAFVKGTVSALSTVFFVWSYALTNSDAFPPPPASRTKAFGWNAAAGFCLVFVSRKLRCQSSRISSCQSSEERSRTP